MRWLQSTSYIFISGMVLKDWKRVCSNGNWKVTKRPTNWWHCLRPRQELSSKAPKGSLSAQSCFIDVLEREPNSISLDGGVQLLTIHVTATREDGQPVSNMSHALHTEAALRRTGPELTWRSRVMAEGATPQSPAGGVPPLQAQTECVQKRLPGQKWLAKSWRWLNQKKKETSGKHKCFPHLSVGLVCRRGTAVDEIAPPSNSYVEGLPPHHLRI